MLPPRIHGAFGDRDWVANAALVAIFHLHSPWIIPTELLVDTFLICYASKRYRGAWIGIAVHSAQTVRIGLALLALVL
ncbi:MAG TPA: hypothetical protein VHF27_13845 [Acidimicrobiales bacterium]|nr:hypothetical protein [Acidimicrobiales bacterium]